MFIEEQKLSLNDGVIWQAHMYLRFVIVIKSINDIRTS